MLTFSEENYLKSIFHLSSDSELGVSTNSIADNLNTKASSVTEMLKKLGDKNLIVYKKYHGAQLTGKPLSILINKTWIEYFVFWHLANLKWKNWY